MANNRLYLYDPESREAFMLAKTIGDGWYVWAQHELDDSLARLGHWLAQRDHTASQGNIPKPTALRLCTESDLPADAILNQESE